MKSIADIQPLFPSEPKKVRSPKATLWLYCYEKCKRQWGGQKPLTRPYFAMRTNHLTTDADWFFIKSLCEQEELRGTPFCKTFFAAITDYETARQSR